MQIAHTPAVTCRCRSYSETSQTVQFFTRDHGMVPGLAKGVLRPQNAFGGPFDTLCAYEIIFIRKSGPGLHTITGADLTHPFCGLRENMDRYVAANFLLEVILALAADGEPNPELYDLFFTSLKVLEDGGDRDPVIMGFVLRALQLVGLGLKFDGCALCGRTGPGGKRMDFAPSEGGVLCPDCGRASEIERQTAQGGMIRARAGDLRVLAALAAADPERLSKINFSPDVREAAFKIVGHVLRFVLEKPPVMLKYML